jgi:ribosomal-protein-alanine N-acetyltransferase
MSRGRYRLRISLFGAADFHICMDSPALVTNRLVLRPLALSDAPAMQRRFPQWDIVRWLQAGIAWPFPEDGAEREIRACLERQARRTRAYWAIALKARPDELIGRISLAPDDGSRDQRGFWIDPAFQRQGLMTEAAERITAYAFLELQWSKLWLTNAAANIASPRIKARQGAQLVDHAERDYMFGPAVREIWLLERSDWLARAEHEVGGRCLGAIEKPPASMR